MGQKHAKHAIPSEVDFREKDLLNQELKEGELLTVALERLLPKRRDEDAVTAEEAAVPGIQLTKRFTCTRNGDEFKQNQDKVQNKRSADKIKCFVDITIETQKHLQTYSMMMS